MASCEQLLTSEQRHKMHFVTWPVMHQRMAFYAGVYVPKVGFTISECEISEYKAFIQKGIEYEQARIEKGGWPKALTLTYLREISGFATNHHPLPIEPKHNTPPSLYRYDEGKPVI